METAGGRVPDVADPADALSGRAEAAASDDQPAPVQNSHAPPRPEATRATGATGATGATKQSKRFD